MTGWSSRRPHRREPAPPDALGRDRCRPPRSPRCARPPGATTPWSWPAGRCTGLPYARGGRQVAAADRRGSAAAAPPTRVSEKRRSSTGLVPLQDPMCLTLIDDLLRPRRRAPTSGTRRAHAQRHPPTCWRRWDADAETSKPRWTAALERERTPGRRARPSSTEVVQQALRASASPLGRPRSACGRVVEIALRGAGGTRPAIEAVRSPVKRTSPEREIRPLADPRPWPTGTPSRCAWPPPRRCRRDRRPPQPIGARSRRLTGAVDAWFERSPAAPAVSRSSARRAADVLVRPGRWDRRATTVRWGPLHSRTTATAAVALALNRADALLEILPDDVEQPTGGAAMRCATLDRFDDAVASFATALELDPTLSSDRPARLAEIPSWKPDASERADGMGSARRHAPTRSTPAAHASPRGEPATSRPPTPAAARPHATSRVGPRPDRARQPAGWLVLALLGRGPRCSTGRVRARPPPPTPCC